MARGVALAGFMGVGKSTVGAELAVHLGLDFVDLDAAIIRRSGRTVPQIFSCEGEAGFRLRETEVLSAVLQDSPVVIALGGGTLHHPGNLEKLRTCCTVVSLMVPLDEIRQRLGVEGGGRPLWSDAEARFAAREEGYRQADICLDVSGLDVGQVVEAVQRSLPCQ